MNRNPVLIVMSVLAGLQVLAGASVLSDLLGAQAGAAAVVVIGAAQAGVQFYVRGVVTPTSDPRDNAGVPLVPQDSEDISDDPILPTEVDAQDVPAEEK